MKTTHVELPDSPMVQKATAGYKHGDPVSVHLHGTLHKKDGKTAVHPSEVECEPMNTEESPAEEAAESPAKERREMKSPKTKGAVSYVLAKKAQAGMS